MGKLNMAAASVLLDKENNVGKSTTDFAFDKLADGKNIRRVLFPKGNKDMFYSDGYVHYQCGPDKKTITCNTTKGESCPICQALYKLKDSDNPEDQTAYTLQKRKRRIAINVLNLDEENPQPKVLFIGATILKGLLQLITDEDYGDITDAETGRNVTITRTGQGLNTSYSVVAKPNASALDNADEIEEKMADLDNLFNIKPIAELQEIANSISNSNVATPVFKAVNPTDSEDVDAMDIIGSVLGKN